MFDPVDPKQSFPALERAMLQYWREEDMFRRSISNREGRTEFSFYDGPPFATGLPHYGHLLAGTIKDVIPRYRTMRGDKVRRRFGWDCHGLPVENLIEKEEGIKSKRDIEAMGVARFNELCKASVQRYVKEWKETVERTGRWVDMDWDYRTMDPSYMESIWWVFKQLSDKNLIYEGRKPMHICPRCATPLSNFEVTQGYKDRTDMSVIMTFPLVDDPKTVILAWTTTPWSLPGNFWLAMGKDVTYAKVQEGDTTYILAEKLVEKVFKGKEYEITGTVKAKELEGKKYQPLFPYFVDAVIPSTAKSKKPETYGDRVFKIVINSAVEVSEDEGTGIVHLTSSTGEDSQAVAESENVDILPHVRIDGSFVDEVKDLAGLNAKPEGEDPMATDKKVIEYLKKHGRHFSSYTITHSYPHCWRCDTPLLPYSTTSWFVEVEKIKEKMLTSNSETEWVPAHIRDGRFGNWLSNARDWAISRNRYWGTPLPVWRTADGSSMDVIAGRQDLMNRQLIRFSKITVVRHGQAEHNVGRFYQSIAPGVDLTEEGRGQAQQAGAFLANQNVRVIYCSPLARTQQTAQAIAEATGAEVIIDERLREIDVGEYEGKAFDRSDLALHALKRKKKLQEGAPESIFHLEGMEKWTDIQKRADDFLRDVLQKHRSDHIVVVTHADVVMNIRHFFTKEDPFKLSHRPYPQYATPEQYYWDHDRQVEMDLHKHIVDDIRWTLPDAGPAVQATLLRHGETEWNHDHRVHGGNADVELNDTGRKQARDAAVALKNHTFDVVVSSDLKRAAETASIIAQELQLPEPIHMEELRERHTGTWSGQKVEDLLKAHPPLEEGIVSLHHETPDGGESLSDFIKRMQNAYDQITTTYAGKKVLIVTHRAVVQALNGVAHNLPYREMALMKPGNAEALDITMRPLLKRIPDVLDCWFESGSMPYAQMNYPYAFQSEEKLTEPQGFPADFIAEGIDQTRGWFYTLTVLSSALFEKSAFKHCVVNGIVLAEDGRKMSKRLKNYPEPTEVVEKHGADAMRFALMYSPAVRGEDIRFSEKTVEDTVRNVLLPFWNSYSFFVTYANLAKFEPPAKPSASNHPLDRWILAEVQDLCNRMTKQLDAYDLSATCDELFETIDALTNWYIRLSRRRFAGKGMSDRPEAEPENFEGDRLNALVTLHQALLTLSQLLAPFCPFITDAVYLNLGGEEHGSVHLTDWPAIRALTDEEKQLIAKNRVLRRIVSLGLTVRSEQKVKVRTPLAKATIAFPASLLSIDAFGADEKNLLRQELNVKEIIVTSDVGSLGERYVMVDARTVGPRLGKRVQEIIQAGKRGEFEVTEDGSVLILEETLSPDEAQVLYRGAEGSSVAADAGVVVALDTTVNEALELEGLARDLIRAIQKLRKEQGYNLGEPVTIGLDETATEILAAHKELIEQETSVTVGAAKGQKHNAPICDIMMTIYMDPKS